MFFFKTQVTKLQTAVGLAVAATLAPNVHAQQPVNIPGINSPVTAASEQAQVAPVPAAAPQPQAQRQVQVSRENADLPPVPASVMSAPAPSRRQNQAVETRQDVIVTNGTNTLIPISRGQINRIVTPFETPNIQTVSTAEISTRDNVVYVTTQDEQPVTMFITPEDDEGLAVSLTLLPQSIPPIQANLMFSQAVAGTAGTASAPRSLAYSGQARRWEQSQPYMESLRGIMRELALGNLPRGYSLAELQSGDAIPDCAQQGLSYDFNNVQYILGHEFRVFIIAAENISAQPTEVLHASCTHPNRAGVAVWPYEILEPGEKSEIFVITRVSQQQAQTSARPSLLN
ncbi:MAG: type-F conjugative transfer system secretin TraK [Halopseudomonas aestusnigri]|nr:type-F conjugative transfer system secretin TraK [Halopseudomonas aestusnigri]